MISINPLQLSLIPKNYTWQKKNYLAITSLLGFPLSGGRPLLEQDMWTKVNEALGENNLDLGMPKPNGEVIVYGDFYSPEGKPVTAGRVLLCCGAIKKELAVIGNRYWGGPLGPSEPEPFTTMPINFEHAFGGKKYDKNSFGKGIEEVDVFGEKRLPLPNIEYPDKLMTSASQRPEPAGFSALDIMCQQRMKYAGTYDDKWITEYAPAYPLDIDWNYFNCASKDQWIDSFWQGNEEYSLHNMHPDFTVLQGNLPEFRSRSFIVPKNSENESLTEVDQRLETIFFLPTQDIGILLWRGVLNVEEDDLTDIHALLNVFEDSTSAPMSLEHYQQVYDNRQNPKLQLKYMNNTDDLIPKRVTCGYRYVTLTEDDMNMPMLENMFVGAEETKNALIEQANQKKDEIKQQLEAMVDKLPPEELKEKLAQIDTEIDFPEFKVPSKAERLAMLDQELEQDVVDYSQLEEEIKAKVQDIKDQSRQKAMDLYEQLKSEGVEEQKLEPIIEAIKNIDLPPVLPRPFVDDLREQLEEQLVTIEKQKQDILNSGGDASSFPVIDTDFDALFVKFKQLEAMQKEGYRLSAHHGELGRSPHTRPPHEIRQDLLDAYKNGDSLKDGDFACIDLSNQDLTGIDLEGAYLEQVNFFGTVLNNANLKGAIIAGSDLSNAKLNEVDLSKANLGKVNFSNTVLYKSNLQQAILEQSQLDKASITYCDLTECEMTDTRFKEVNFSNSTLNHFTVTEQDLSGCQFDHCQLNDANFTKCQFSNASFTEATMVKSSFSDCHAARANYSKANLENARFHEECNLKNSNFKESKLERAVFQFADLEGAIFDKARFYMADFSQSNLQHASFRHAIGKKSQFMKSDLGYAKMTSMNMMQGTLFKARLTWADFSDSNLYGVNFMQATVGDTNFNGANLDMTQLETWNP